MRESASRSCDGHIIRGRSKAFRVPPVPVAIPQLCAEGIVRGRGVVPDARVLISGNHLSRQIPSRISGSGSPENSHTPLFLRVRVVRLQT
jgi:hypothetical protein